MNIKVQSRDIAICDTRNKELSNLIYTQLSRYGYKVKRTEMVLSRIIQPDSTPGFKCLIRMRLNHLKTIAVHESSSELQEAIDICLSRARRTLGRQLERNRQMSQQLSTA